MTIYTKTGDNGMTSLAQGQRVSKSDPRVCAYGTIDELNSILGIVIAAGKNEKKVSQLLLDIQNDLFTIGNHLAGGKQSLVGTKKRISQMEELIGNLEKKLPPLRNFILPGRTSAAAFAHQARSVCRRAEREVVTVAKTVQIDKAVLIYLNRLSDLLFMIARYLNYQKHTSEILWKIDK